MLSVQTSSEEATSSDRARLERELWFYARSRTQPMLVLMLCVCVCVCVCVCTLGKRMRGQSAMFLAAPQKVLSAMSTIPSTAATPLLLRVLGAVQLMAAAATWVLKVRR